MTKPTWSDVVPLIANECETLTGDTLTLLERMAKVADANETTPLYWRSDDEVLTLLRDMVADGGHYNTFRRCATRMGKSSARSPFFFARLSE